MVSVQMAMYVGATLAGGFLWNGNPDLAVTLHTNAYVPDRANHRWVSDLTNELPSGGGYTVGGVNLANATSATYSAYSWPIAWQPNYAYNQSELVRPTVANGLVYRLVVPGTSGAVEPTWTSQVGLCLTDGTAQWVATGAYILELAADDLVPAWSALTAGPFRHMVISDRNHSTPSTQPLIGVFTMPADQLGTGSDLDVVFSPAGIMLVTIP
jgi:hypothetical protein